MDIIIPIVVLSGLGLMFGLVLGIAKRIFYVHRDERISAVLGALPNVNCGGCGYSGCASYADAVVLNGERLNACPVGGSETINAIADIMGVSAGEFVKLTARVLCGGNEEFAHTRFLYNGVQDCYAANRLSGGHKHCTYGCLGFGSCARICAFGAISVIKGVAVVDENKCTACGACVERCPKDIIKLMPVDKRYTVLCRNAQRGKIAREVCKISCIGCGICEKSCPEKAITMENNIAEINPDKCTNCGVCQSKCPRNTITEHKNFSAVINIFIP